MTNADNVDNVDNVDNANNVDMELFLARQLQALTNELNNSLEVGGEVTDSIKLMTHYSTFVLKILEDLIHQDVKYGKSAFINSQMNAIDKAQGYEWIKPELDKRYKHQRNQNKNPTIRE